MRYSQEYLKIHAGTGSFQLPSLQLFQFQHSVAEHLPRDREDSVYDRVLGVLCWLYVNISYKWRVQTMLEEENVSPPLIFTQLSVNQALLLQRDLQAT